ncbi:signal peptidase I [Rhodococcus spelaei]|uniref:Signal peptidase I n=1 Tax=Rhodococcus spelaei TaxID=2546320 RepID=A0A541BA05_9NOCA|nr:signal peptidase I [Rhodococcus spelaei]TQF69068.1 signal peptidase I [Rhodococcus spelaei]
MSDTVEGADLGAWGWVKSIVSWLVLIAVVAILALTIVVPRLTGSTPYTVLTGSMIPTYPPGTLIVVKPQDPMSLRVGDAITFQKESGNPTVVTHRIIESRQNSQGERSFVTQGDANPSRDQNPVVPEQVRGKVWYSVPYLGYVNNVITGQQRALMIVVVVGGLFLYAGYMFVGAIRERTRKGRPDGQAPTDPVPAPASVPAPAPVPVRAHAGPTATGSQWSEADTIVMPRIDGRHRAP